MPVPRRKSRRERKAEAERVARFHAAREAAVRGSGYGARPAPGIGGPLGVPGASGPGELGGLAARRVGVTPAGTARTREEARTQRPWTRATSAAFVTGAALVALGAIATIWRGAAVMGNGWRPWALASTGALTALVAWGLWRLVRAHHQVPRRLVSSSLAACAAVVVLFAVGAAVSPVVDGRVVPVTSKEARVQRDALAMRDDLLRLADLDQLLILDATAGRARFSEYQDAVDELDAMSGRWARRNPDGFADAALAPVAADLASAARYASVAMTRKRDLLTTDDSRLAAQVAANRESFSAAVLDAGPRLAAVAERYGFSVAAPRQGPTE